MNNTCISNNAKAEALPTKEYYIYNWDEHIIFDQCLINVLLPTTNEVEKINYNLEHNFKYEMSI